MIVKRISSLDLLKFICSILIVFHHFQQVTNVKFNIINFWDGKFYFGFIVELFFMISGFLCIYNYNSKEDFYTFIKKKAIRIYPMSILSIICIYFIELLNYFIFGSSIKIDGLGIWTIFTNVSLLFGTGFIPSIGLGINNPLWYCSILLICYVIFFYVAKHSYGLKDYFIYPFLLLMLNTVLKQLGIDNSNFFRGVISFFIGICMFYVYCILSKKDIIKKKSIIILAFLLIIYLLLAIINYEIFFEDLRLILTFIIWPTLLLFIVLINNYNNNFSIYGKLSFEIYIWHPFFLRLLITLERAQIINNNYSFYQMLLFTILLIIFCLLIVILVEKYVNILVNKLLNNFNS